MQETAHDFLIRKGHNTGDPVCRIYHSDRNEWTIDFDLRTGLDYTGRTFTRTTRAAAIEFALANLKAGDIPTVRDQESPWRYMTEAEDRDQYGPVENLG